MVQFLSIIFFLGFLQLLLGFSKVPVFLCHPVFTHAFLRAVNVDLYVAVLSLLSGLHIREAFLKTASFVFPLA